MSMAITHFARALGAARSGNPDAAKADIAKLAELRDKLREAKDGYWAEHVDIQWQIATAWVLNAEGKYDEALKAMSAAADAEDKTEKSPVTPGPLAPARELYGEMLLEHGMAKEALAAFEATKAKEPNRFRGFAGAAKAAEKLGDKAKAKANYEKLRRAGRRRRRPIGRRSRPPRNFSARTRPQAGPASGAMRKTTVILAVAAFALGGLVGAYALLAERPPDRGAAAARRIRSGPRCTGRSRWTSGARARRSAARPPTAAPRSTSTSAPRSASAIARPASPTTRSSTASATSTCSATSSPRWRRASRSRSPG